MVVVHAAFEGANQSIEISGTDLLDYRCNYFQGNDTSKWRTDVPNYSGMVYRNVYRGIDIHFDGRDGLLKTGYKAESGADLSQIQFSYDGDAEVALSKSGELTIATPWGTLIQSAPAPRRDGSLTTQYRVGESTYGIQADEVSEGAQANSGTVTLVYSTYLGGSDSDAGIGIAVDGFGSAYVTGGTYSTDFPTQNPHDGSYNGAEDVFVTELTPTGNALEYSTYLGGSSYDDVQGIAVDGSGNAYVTGYTSSSDFPTQNPFDSSRNASSDDVFVSKLAATGNALEYSTYLGGSFNDYGRDITVDTSGNAYVTGLTSSSRLPHTGSI